MSIIGLFLEQFPPIFVVLVPPLVLDDHGSNLLIDYVLGRAGNHFGDAKVSHMGHYRELSYHAQVSHVHALTVEGQLEALTVDRHYQQTIQHLN